MNRRKRSERRKNQEVFGGPSPYIKRNIPFFDILHEEQLQIIEDQVDWLIENIGKGIGANKCKDDKVDQINRKYQ